MRTARLLSALFVLGLLYTSNVYSQGSAPWEYWRDVQTPITDFQTAASSITISDVFTVSSIQVMVDVQHSAASDLLITLNTPTGNYVLSSYNGGVNDNYENTIFDPLVTNYPCSGAPSGTNAVPGVYVNEATNQSAYYRGVYKPQPGTVFNTGGSAIGTWTIQVFDNVMGDNGVLRKWGLIFNRYGQYKDVRWGWDINHLNRCGAVTGSRMPYPFVDKWGIFNNNSGWYPYTVAGARPMGGYVFGVGLLQNSKTASTAKLTLTRTLPGGMPTTLVDGQYTLAVGMSGLGFNIPTVPVNGTMNLSAEIYERSDLFMTRNDNTITASVPLTPASLAYDNGSCLGTTNTPVNNCEASVFTIEAQQTLTSVDVWEGSNVELEPAASAARLDVRVWDASSGSPGAQVATTGLKSLPIQGNKWVTYSFNPPIVLPIGQYAFGVCTDVAPTMGGIGLGTDRTGSPYDWNGTLSKLYNFGIEYFSMTNGSTWNAEVLRIFATKMIRPNFVQGSDVGVIAILSPAAMLPASFSPVVRFGAFAHHPQLPNLVTFGKVSVIDNATGQVVRYSERRVYLQNAPYLTDVTFDNMSGLAAGSYTIKAEVERSDDENLINNSYSRQYTKAFAPIMVVSNGPLPSIDRNRIAETYADMEREVVFMDRSQAGWSLPASGDVLWVGAIAPNDAPAVRDFVQNGNSFSVLPNAELTGDVQTSVFASLATPAESAAMTNLFRGSREQQMPTLVPSAENMEMLTGTSWFMENSRDDAQIISRTITTQSLLARLDREQHGTGASRPMSYTASEDLTVDALRLGNLSVLQVLAKHTPQARPVVNAIANPSDFEITQNYPNPFNPTTNIAYNLPTDAHVTLAVFDMLGRQVATLANGSQTAGRYLVTWDGRNDNREDVASGVYLYRLEAATAVAAPFVASKKMVLAR